MQLTRLKDTAHHAWISREIVHYDPFQGFLT